MRRPIRYVLTIAMIAASQTAAAQETGALFVTLSGGAVSTRHHSTSSLFEADEIGYLGRIGIQTSMLNPRLLLGAELEYSRYWETYTGPSIWCAPWWTGSNCVGGHVTVKGFNLRGQWALIDAPARFQPYASFGTGWMRVPTNRDPETIGPKIDLGLGLAIDPIGTGLIHIALEPRYTFFYFLEETDDSNPSQVSVVASTSVRLVRW